jgi:DNA-binding MarR family transcriptional regulator
MNYLGRLDQVKPLGAPGGQRQLIISMCESSGRAGKILRMPASRRATNTAQTPAGRLDEARLGTVLGYQLAQATIVTDAIFRDAAGVPLELRPVEYTVLTLIAENPGGSSARLSRALAVTPPHITAIVDRLVARGLVQRTASAEDRRSQVLGVTRAGSELVRKATERIVKAEHAALALTPGEQAILAELLHKVACARDPSS